MISANNAFTSTNTTINSLTYIDTLVADASSKGLYFIEVDGTKFNDDMSNDLYDNYGYNVTKRYFDMGLYPVYTISWNSSGAYFPNYILEYDFSNLDSYPTSGTTVYDLMGHSNGTLGGSPTFNSQYGGTLSFNSTSSQYIINNNNLAQYFAGTAPNKSTSFSAVMSINASNNGILLKETSQAGWHNSVIELVDGTVKFSSWEGSGVGSGLRTMSSTITTPFETWHHIVMTYDGTTMKGYVNGELACSRAITRREPYNDQPTPGAIYYAIGQSDTTNAGDGTYGDFTLGRFELLDGALSANDVSDKYNYHLDRFN
jgi:hypothetical protein